MTSVEGDRVSVIYHTPQHLDRLRQDDWDILRDTGFPVDQLWEGGLLKDLSDAEDDDCPQEQIMTVRQTTPAFSESEFYVAEDLDLDANSVFRPTLQAVLWLSELIAITTLKKGNSDQEEVLNLMMLSPCERCMISWHKLKLSLKMSPTW